MELALTAGQVTFGQGLLEHLGIAPNGKISVTHAPGGHLDIAAAGHRSNTKEMQALLTRAVRAYCAKRKSNTDEMLAQPRSSPSTAEQKDSTDEMLAQLKALNDAYKGEKIHLTIEEIQKGIEEAYVARGLRGLE